MFETTPQGDFTGFRIHDNIYSGDVCHQWLKVVGNRVGEVVRY